MRLVSNMRILMTTDTVGGVWTYATGLASALAASTADVYLVTTGPRPRPDQREMLWSSQVNVIESDLALEWQDPQGDDFGRACELLAGLERQIKPDLVHLNSYREATFAWHAPVVVVAHSCVNSWAAACGDRTFLLEPRWQRYTDLVAAGLDNADAWVSPTRAFGETVRDLYRLRTEGVVIRNGSAPISGSAKSKVSMILAAGRMWDAAKNLVLLAEAVKGLDWPVFVAGPVDQTVSGIELLGEISHSELGARMQDAAIFVSPACYEPFGLSVLEAAGAGCALVLSDIPTFRELWDGAAIFVAPDDVSELRKVLADLCNNQSKRVRLQQAALRRAKRYSRQRMTASYARLYRSLLSPRSVQRKNALEVHA